MARHLYIRKRKPPITFEIERFFCSRCIGFGIDIDWDVDLLVITIALGIGSIAILFDVKQKGASDAT